MLIQRQRSASVEERETDSDFHEMMFEPRYKMYAVVDLPAVDTPPQSESEKATSSWIAQEVVPVGDEVICEGFED
ncbi:hypothetical protein Tco_0321062 [Tanacetum coccineum]